MKPTIGRIVVYKSKIDNGEGNDVLSPAMVVRTRDTTVPAVIERWLPFPTEVRSFTDDAVHETSARPDDLVVEFPDDDTVDLVVFGLGKTYREYAVANGPGRGEWEWPNVYFAEWGVDR